jgi:hypothetical protein
VLNKSCLGGQAHKYCQERFAWMLRLTRHDTAYRCCQANFTYRDGPSTGESNTTMVTIAVHNL